MSDNGGSLSNNTEPGNDATTGTIIIERPVVIEVNGREIGMSEGLATGLEIKKSAITQGANIQLNFVLQQELPNGTAKVIGDDDKVLIDNNLRFTAIAPDDNS